MTIRIAWLPEGVEPKQSDFRVMRKAGTPGRGADCYDNPGQVLKHLNHPETEWPEGLHPWMRLAKGNILNPAQVKSYVG